MTTSAAPTLSFGSMGSAAGAASTPLSNVAATAAPDARFAELEQRLTVVPRSHRLALEFFQLEELPNSLSRGVVVSHLHHLNLSHNSISVLSPAIGLLVSLESLAMEHNGLQSLPPSIANLSNLQRLHLAGNALKLLSPDIGGLCSLRRLFLDHNSLLSLPPAISSLTRLEWLSLDGNKLTTLPTEFGRLKSLAWCSANQNDLDSLPDVFSGCLSLSFLSLLNNSRLSHLPQSLLTLKELTDLRTSPPVAGWVVPPSARAIGSRAVIEYMEVALRTKTPINIDGHWVPDAASTTCQSCSAAFSNTRRRHHCRVCGRLLCAKCSPKKGKNIPHLRLEKVRLCEDCFGVLQASGRVS